MGSGPFHFEEFLTCGVLNRISLQSQLSASIADLFDKLSTISLGDPLVLHGFPLPDFRTLFSDGALMISIANNRRYVEFIY